MTQILLLVFYEYLSCWINEDWFLKVVVECPNDNKRLKLWRPIRKCHVIPWEKRGSQSMQGSLTNMSYPFFSYDAYIYIYINFNLIITPIIILSCIISNHAFTQRYYGFYPLGGTLGFYPFSHLIKRTESNYSITNH